ncbi:hypothetical protein SCANM124S_06941 [Streptomyces canus]
MLYTGITWQQLPLELGVGSGQTCWRRLGRWHEAGVFEALHRMLLAELHAAGQIDWTRACGDASHVKAEKEGARRPARRRSTGARPGNGTPFTVITTAANVNDVTQTLALVDGIPPVAGRMGRPRRRPEALLGDKGYDSNPNRRELRNRRILPVISRKGSPNIAGLGKLRYVVEQTFALSTSSSASRSAGNDASTSTTPSSHSPADSSAGDDSDDDVRDEVEPPTLISCD